MIRRINLFGGPGVGKSTLAAVLYAALKSRGASVELVREKIKLRAMKKQPPESFEQFGFFAKQLASEDDWLRAGAELIVTDCPLWLPCFYAKHHEQPGLAAVETAAWEFDRTYKALNLFLNRPAEREYEITGRLHSKKEALAIDVLLYRYLLGKVRGDICFVRPEEPADVTATVLRVLEAKNCRE